MNQIKKARILAGMTQGELAERLSVSKVAVSLWESGKHFPSVKRLSQVAKVLNIAPEKLLEDKRAI